MANHPNRSLPPIARALKTYRARAVPTPAELADREAADSRVKDGITVAEAEARHGVPPRTWEGWEQRGRAPTTNLATAFASILGELL